MKVVFEKKESYISFKIERKNEIVRLSIYDFDSLVVEFTTQSSLYDCNWLYNIANNFYKFDEARNGIIELANDYRQYLENNYIIEQ